jgi:hypothetical protein
LDINQKVPVLLVTLLVGIFVITITTSPVVYSQFYPCNIVNLAPTGPPNIGAGQPLEVTTTVTGACDQSMFYAVRIDLVDGRSSQVLSSVVFPYAPVTASFTVAVINKATAPTNLGTWVLQVNGYLIASVNGGVVASAHVLFNVVVVPYTPPATTTEQMITNSTTSLSLMFTNSTSQMISSNETPFVTSASSAAPENTQTNSTLIVVAAIVVVLAAIVVVMLSRRKRATAQKPQSSQLSSERYCGHCGTKLSATDEFCSQCGNKQN